MPIVKASWYSDTIIPRNREGENSEMYKGETIDATPMPNPPTKRNITNVVNEPESMQPTADIRNKTADSINTTLRPYLSLSLPEKLTPIMQPRRAQLTNQPSLTALRLKSCVTKLTVPEMTAVSKPNKNPPSAATRQTRYR